MKSFLIALSFFTRIPINIKSEVTEDEFYSSMKLLPLIGLVIGTVLYALWYVTKGINEEVYALLLVFIYIWLTGGLHIDGFIDTIDGVLSNRDRDKILEIMKDSRIGAFGAIGLLMLVLTYFVLFQQLTGFALLLMPMVGRSCAMIAASFSDYAKKTKDLGKNYVESIGSKERWFALIFTSIVIGLVEYRYLLSYVVCVLVSLFMVRYFKKKLSGITGDIVGMLIEFNQMIFLISTYLIIFYLGGK